MESQYAETLIDALWKMEQPCLPYFDAGVLAKCCVEKALSECGFPYTHSPYGVQARPDYLVGDGWLEVRNFDTNRTPSFDIVPYNRLICDLESRSKSALYADFLVLGYQESDGILRIENVDMYKIWQIVNYYIDNDGSRRVLTNTRGVIRPRSDLRPNDNSNQPSFADEYEFITALYKDVAETEGEHYAEQWLTNVQNRLLND